MDLSFKFDRDLLERDWAVTAIPTELAVLMVGVAARQAASFTAQLQSDLSRVEAVGGLLSPTHGAFNNAVEAALTRWQQL
ncbi:hypothetical protein [Sphingomonas sp. LT1P40]|uniref:hypothetical protein n=1 Tax=Alteristakelama amylovorans TaxID=3096166 RepID=UPI002FC7242B